MDEPLEKTRRAIGFALRKHEGQLRKDGKTPYGAHPMRIFARLSVELNVKDEDVLAAGILHDTIEDTKTDYDDIVEHFGERCARFVANLTNDKRLPEKERDAEFSRRLAAAPWEVRLVKMCDMLDNALDSVELGAAKRASYLARKREEFEPMVGGMPDWTKPFVEKVRRTLSQA